MRILVVDDEFEARESIKNMLSTIKAEVAYVSDAVSGLLYLKDNTDVDRIITDYKLHGLGGKDWVDLLQHYHPQVRLVVITGHDVAFDRLKDTSALQLLRKPFTKAELFTALGI